MNIDTFRQYTESYSSKNNCVRDVSLTVHKLDAINLQFMKNHTMRKIGVYNYFDTNDRTKSLKDQKKDMIFLISFMPIIN